MWIMRDTLLILALISCVSASVSEEEQNTSGRKALRANANDVCTIVPIRGRRDRQVCTHQHLKAIISHAPRRANRETYHLNISHNDIASFKPRNFKRVGQYLKILDLSHNQLSILESNIFSELANVSHLLLHHNNITLIDYAAFNSSGPRRMQHLNLGHNMLSSLPANVFQSIKTLRTLSLDHNLLSSLPNDIFRPFTILRQLFLNHNRLASFPNRTVETLKKLDLSHNQFTSIESLPRFPFVIHLDISHNQIIDISPTFFHEKFPILKHLSLGSNAFYSLFISPINADSPIPLPNLISLDMSDSYLNHLFIAFHPGLPIFKYCFSGCGLTNLPAVGQRMAVATFLDVSRNPLLPNAPMVLRHWSRLRTLNIAETGLTDLNFLNNTHQGLIDLNLSGNLVEPGSLSLLSRFPNLTNLHLSNMGLSLLPQDFLGTDRRPYSHSRLQYVDLSDNELMELQPNAFDLSYLASLKILKLNNNSLVNISTSIFGKRAYSAMRVIDLSDNNLVTLPSNLLQSTLHLEEFYADHNQITTLGADLFRGLSLYILSLKDNLLQNLPADLFNAFWMGTNETDPGMLQTGLFKRYRPYLERVDFSDNPLNASSSTCPLAVLVEIVERRFAIRTNYTKNTFLRHFDDKQHAVKDELTRMLFDYPCGQTHNGVRPILSCNSQGKQVCLVRRQEGQSQSIIACGGDSGIYPRCKFKVRAETFRCYWRNLTSAASTKRASCMTWLPTAYNTTSATLKQSSVLPEPRTTQEPQANDGQSEMQRSTSAQALQTTLASQTNQAPPATQASETTQTSQENNSSETTQAWQTTMASETTQVSQENNSSQTTQAWQTTMASETTQTSQENNSLQTTQAWHTTMASETTQVSQENNSSETTLASQATQAPQTTQAWQTTMASETSQVSQENNSSQTTQAGQITQAPQTSQAWQTTIASVTTQVSQENNSSQTTLASQATEASQITQAWQTTPASSTTQALQTTLDSPKNHDLQTTKASQTTHSSSTTQASQTTPASQAAQASQTTHALQAIHPSQTNQTSQTTQASPITQTLETSEALQTIQALQTTQASRTTPASQTHHASPTTKALSTAQGSHNDQDNSTAQTLSLQTKTQVIPARPVATPAVMATGTNQSGEIHLLFTTQPPTTSAVLPTNSLSTAQSSTPATSGGNLKGPAVATNASEDNVNRDFNKSANSNSNADVPYGYFQVFGSVTGSGNIITCAAALPLICACSATIFVNYWL
ncbi:uncharacterized protein LOC135824689 [Sycon ciliatum]|uniref:uncharacterized protein LOC135824689 n=1 Tax=Sycon ciliatum TaxID=27933 RepID=UPI0031F6595A